MLANNLEAVVQGDGAAWRRFYRHYNPLVTASVAGVLRRRQIPFGPADLDDHVAETWLTLLRRDAVGLRRFDPARGRTLPSWLRLLAVRSTIDQLRGRVQQQRLRECQAEVDRCDETSRPDVLVETHQRIQAAREVLACLRPGERQFIDLCLQDMDTADVARQMGIAVATVYSRWFKLGQKLRRMLQRQRRRESYPGELAAVTGAG